MLNYRLFFALLLVAFSSISMASLMSNDDIDLISVNAPSNWTTLNTHQLFDGVSDRYTNTRFAAYQNNGDILSSSNVYNISVSLTNSKHVDSLGFYSDWRYLLQQQVASMSVALYNESNGLLWSSSFANLKQNSWEKITLFEFSTPIVDVKRIDYTVTGSQGNHFEIRELLVGFTNSPNLQVGSINASAPPILMLIGLGLGAILWRRNKKVQLRGE